MNNWYLDNDNLWKKTDNTIYIKIQNLLQRLQTFSGEQSFNFENGIDYISVFNKQSLLKPQLENIISEYSQYFKNVEYEVLNPTETTILVNLTITLFNDDVVNESFTV